jgi:glycerate dehydrogenase
VNIVVLDGHTLKPGDLSWDEQKQLGNCTFYERSTPDEVIPRLAGADVALTNKVPISREVISSLPNMRYIGVMATGYNIVDTQAAREHNVIVTNVPAYGTDSVAQATFALLLELTNRVGAHADSVRDGRWARSPDFCYWEYPLVELAGLTLGIVGFGRIGQQVARIGAAFGMNILAWQRTQPAGTVQSGNPPLDTVAQRVDLETLLRSSDVISLHCPLTPETKGLINAERISLMKRSAFLLNTSRGPLIVEQDLADALQAERIAGAGLDVLSVEPPAKDNPLFRAPNCCITPHQAWATRAARRRLLNTLTANLKAFAAGTPENVVN